MILRRTTGILLSAALALPALLVVAPPAQANGNCVTYWGARGSGTLSSPYPVANQTDLDEVRFCLDKVFRQTADVVLTGTWTPIGTSGLPFTGTYDGNGFSINGLSINSPASQYLGLFGATDSPARITDTHVSGVISGQNYVGGLIGRATDTTVTRSTTDVTILGIGPGTPQNYHGGLIGRANNVTVTDASTHVAIGLNFGGGFSFVGGLIGAAISTEVTRSRSAGTINGSNDAGGLVGQMIDGSVSESFATSTVTSSDSRGGLIGTRAGSAVVRDVFARGSVTGPLTESGGLIGDDQATGGSGSQTRAYATGLVSGSGNVGGFIGIAGSAIPWTASFWDTQTSGQTSAESSGLVTGVTGLATPAMKDIATYRAAGWSISNVIGSGATWGICPSVNDGYPFLHALTETNPCAVAAPGDAPPPWPQAYARAHDETCLSGWNPSWAQWPNGRTGGFVCQRTLVYNQSTGQWDVRSAHTLKARIVLP